MTSLYPIPSYTWSFPCLLNGCLGCLSPPYLGRYWYMHMYKTKLNCLFCTYLQKIDDCMTLWCGVKIWHAEVAQSASKPEDVWQQGEDPFDGVSGSRRCDGRGRGENAEVKPSLIVAEWLLNKNIDDSNVYIYICLHRYDQIINILYFNYI